MAFTGWYQPINWDLVQKGESPAESTSKAIQNFLENQRRTELTKAEIQEREARTAEFQAQALERSQKAQQEQEKNRKLAEKTKLEAEALAAMQRARQQNPSLTQTQTMKVLKNELLSRGLSAKDIDTQYQKRLEQVFKNNTPYELRKDVMDYWDLPYTREQYEKETRKVMGLGGEALVDIGTGEEVAPQIAARLRQEKYQTKAQERVAQLQDRLKLASVTDANARERILLRESLREKSGRETKEEQAKKAKLYTLQLNLAKLDGRIAGIQEDPIMLKEVKVTRLRGLMKQRGVMEKRLGELGEDNIPLETPVVTPTPDTQEKPKFKLPSQMFGGQK